MCLAIAEVANQSESKSHISYCVTANNHITYIIHGHMNITPISSSLTYMLLLS